LLNLFILKVKNPIYTTSRGRPNGSRERSFVEKKKNKRKASAQRSRSELKKPKARK